MRNPFTPNDPEGFLERRRARQAARQERRTAHESKREAVPPKLSDRAQARLAEEPAEAPEPLVDYSPWGNPSPYRRFKHPRRRNMPVAAARRVARSRR